MLPTKSDHRPLLLNSKTSTSDVTDCPPKGEEGRRVLSVKQEGGGVRGGYPFLLLLASYPLPYATSVLKFGAV